MNNISDYSIEYIIKATLTNVLTSSTNEMAAKRFKISGTIEIAPEDSTEIFKPNITDGELSEVASNFESDQIIMIAERYLKTIANKEGSENQWIYIFNFLKEWRRDFRGNDAKQVRLVSHGVHFFFLFSFIGRQ